METKKEIKKSTAKFINSVGRRKRAIASIWFYEKKGEFTINGVPIEEFSKKWEDSEFWLKPFHAVGISHPKSRYSATIRVRGGGISTQDEAIVLAISRALVKSDPSLKPALRTEGFMTRDSREVERKKTSQPGARKKSQYSKR